MASLCVSVGGWVSLSGCRKRGIIKSSHVETKGGGGHGLRGKGLDIREAKGDASCFLKVRVSGCREEGMILSSHVESQGREDWSMGCRWRFRAYKGRREGRGGLGSRAIS